MRERRRALHPARERRRSERGAVTLVVAITMVALMGAASLALDIGLARVGVRDMQAVADLVALDQAKLIDGRTTALLEADPAWRAAAAASLSRNSDAYPAPALTLVLGRVSAGEFVVTSAGEVPNAVRVTSSGTVDYMLRDDSEQVSRSAVAVNDKTACIAVGSYAAQIKRNSASLLTSLIGDALDINVLGYQGLLNADVALLDVAARMDVGTVEQLASLDGVSVGDWYAAIAAVLRRDGQAATASLLDGTLQGSVSSLPDIDLGGLISVGPEAGKALDGRINVLDLVAGAAFLADGSSFASIPSLTANLNPAGLSSTNLTLQDVDIIQTPVATCGRVGVTAENSQIDLILRGPLAAIAVPNPGIALATVSGTIELKVTVALAEGTLADINCKQGTPTNPDKVTVDTRTVLLRPALSLALNVRVGTVTTPLSVRVTAAETTTSSAVVVNLPPNVQHYNAGASTLSGVTPVVGPNTLATNVLNAIYTSITRPIAVAADGLINGSLRTVVGMDIASADVFAFPRPKCSSSRLVQ